MFIASDVLACRGAEWCLYGVKTKGDQDWTGLVFLGKLARGR